MLANQQPVLLPDETLDCDECGWIGPASAAVCNVNDCARCPLCGEPVVQAGGNEPDTPLYAPARDASPDAFRPSKGGDVP